MKSRLLIFCWLGLLLPTLVAGGLLYRLLRNEQARIAESSQAAASGQARALVEQVAFTLSDIKQQVLAGLEELTPDELMAWCDGYPLARNVFAWREDGTVLVPDAQNGLTEEEERFLQRYEPFFSGRQPWKTRAPDDQPVPAAQSRYNPLSEVRSLNWEKAQDMRLAGSARIAPRETGWIPWFAGDRLYFLGWIHHAPQAMYTGVELETAAIVSRLVSLLPSELPHATTCAVLDGNGQVVFQRGAQEVDAQTVFTATLPIGQELPHWSVAVYTGSAGGASTGRAFALLALLIAGAFVAVIVASGTLLMWHARRNLLDARRKTTFVSNVSHELKTPLTTIRMYAEMLGEGRVKDDVRKAEYLETMIRESRRLTRLVNNVLDFSRIEQGRKKYRLESLDLCEVVRDVLTTQAERLSEAGMELVVEDGNQACTVHADRDAVEQIALNLVDNAIKYAASGGRLTVRLGCEAQRCLVEFIDAGSGVTSGQREQIFEQFYRVDDSLTAEQPGCGLGLSIARRLARDHGGELSYYPEPGGGSRFTLALPKTT